MALKKFSITPVFTKAMAALPYEPGLESDTTFKTRYGDIVHLGYREGDLFYVPREMVFDFGEDLRALGDKVELKIKYPPKNEQQEEILSKSLRLFEQDRSHILQAGTGTGKTYLSLYLAAQLGRRTLIVVTKDRMVQQWKNEITKFLGIPQDQIGHIQQDKMTCKDKPVTVAMLHSLCTDKYPDWIKEYFGFIVFDETHNLGAETFSRVAGMFAAKYRLGLSATPKRNDAKEFIFMAHIGQVGVVSNATLLTPKVIVTRTQFKLPLVTKKLPGGTIIKVPYPVTKGKLGRVNQFLANNSERNDKIVNFTKQAYDKGRYTVIFTDLVDKHIKPLRLLLLKAGIPAEDIGMFSRSAVKLNELDEQKFKRIVLTTYGQCAEAIDVPRWDTCVLALPRSNIKQIIGRVLRENEDKSHPVVFDLVDAEVPVLREYYQGRSKIYQEMQAEVLQR
jgi:superfamily II DNA or RNA helicase